MRVTILVNMFKLALDKYLATSKKAKLQRKRVKGNLLDF